MRQVWLVSVMLGFWVSCTPGEQKEASNGAEEKSRKLKVATVNYPLAFFAEEIGGKSVEVIFLAPTDTDPAYWVPGTEAIMSYQEADLILLNGAGYARWIANTSLPSSRLVNTSASVADRYIEVTGEVAHSHGPQGEHTHSETAITTWLDLSIADAQAIAVRDALVRKMPEKEKELNVNYQELAASLDKLNGQFANAFEEVEVLYGSHPVYQYLARAYGVTIHSVHWEPGQEITGEQWHELEHITGHHKGSIMLWEGEPATGTAERLSQQGVQSVVFDPCGNTPAEGNLLEVMQQNLRNFRAALEPGTAQ